jgi:signal peptidase I
MKLVKAAYIVAFVVSALLIVSALLDEIVFLTVAAIPLMAGIGIVRKRVWSAYGYALFQCAGLLAMPLLLLRVGHVDRLLLLEALGSAAFSIALAILFFLAGRRLQAAGCKRGLASLWIALSVLYALPMVFFQAFVIPSGAMENTLLIGDHVLVQCLPKPRPSRGDIIVFRYAVNRRETYVKRVIGVPGDRIRISNKVVYRNGAPLQEPYAIHVTSYLDPYRDNFPSKPNTPLESRGMEMLDNHVVNGEVVVPEKNYFVLGDNRDDSLDSRYQGFVAADDVVGRPFLIYDSQDRPTIDLDGNKSSPPHRTRWKRLFKIL